MESFIHLGLLKDYWKNTNAFQLLIFTLQSQNDKDRVKKNGDNSERRVQWRQTTEAKLNISCLMFQTEQELGEGFLLSPQIESTYFHD